MNRNGRAALAASLFAACALFGCSKKEAAQLSRAEMADSMVMAEAPMMAGRGFAPEPPADMIADEAGGSFSEDAKPAAPTPAERKLVRTGSVQLEVESLKDARAAAEAWVRSFGGYVAQSGESESRLSMTARIPSARFDEAMAATGSFGRTLSRDVSSQDVTEQFYDLSSRLRSKEIMRGRLEGYLASAKDVKDMLEIEVKLNEVTADLESMRSRMNRLSGQIEYATITLSAALPVNRTEDGFATPDVRGMLREFAGNVLGFFAWILGAVLYVVVFGVPLVLLAALAFWVTFGRLGLVRRLFGALRSKK